MRLLQSAIVTDQPDNIAAKGYKIYSQNDEDGLIAHIFETVPGGTFLEIGVEDGTECNTHALLLQGWRGAWVEANPAMCKRIRRSLGTDRFPGRFELFQQFALEDNIAPLYRSVCAAYDVSDLSLLSLDIDGRDLSVLRALIASGARPMVLCVEYNGSFPPPIIVSADHQGPAGWTYDDYMGASLQAFYDMLSEYGYLLITCNLVGANAFFVRSDCWEGRPSFRPAEVFQPLRLYLAPLPGGHKPTLKFLRDALAKPLA